MKKMSTIETAVYLMEQKKTSQPIATFLKEVSEIMGIDENDTDRMAQVYIDMTTSGRFIFCGDGKWDLKERRLDLWDKDGSFFVDDEKEEEEILKEFSLSEENKVESNDTESEDETIEDEESDIDEDNGIDDDNDDEDGNGETGLGSELHYMDDEDLSEDDEYDKLYRIR